MPNSSYSWIVEQRRKLCIDGYFTLADVGFDGHWVTPYQKTSCSHEGPVLVALHWLDAPSIEQNRPILSGLGYLPGIRFNNVLDLALGACRLSRHDIYVTQVFHLIPCKRSERIPPKWLDCSFDAVTRHELRERQVVALGADAAKACHKHGVRHIAACHPSRRGKCNAENAEVIAAAIKACGT